MMMKNKSKPKKVVIGIIIFILSCLYINGGYLFIKDTDDSPAKVVVADGIITNKFEAGYGCGKSSTCYYRSFTINRKEHAVSLNTFIKADIGDSVVLVEDASVDKSGLYGLLVWVFLFFSVLLLCYFIVKLFDWLTDDKQ